MKIRNVTVADLEAIALIESKSGFLHFASLEDFQKFLSNNNPNHYIDIIEQPEGSKLMGFIGYSILVEDGVCHIWDVAVAPPFRRKKCATKLINFVFDRCLRLGIKAVKLEVPFNNLSAQALYLKLGFQRVITDQNYRGNESGSYPMIKQISDLEWEN